ncbi:MAG: 5-methyltetrahydropteroyltriglutamate--homocysteine S-methyltransferase [Propioniciclava sp.]|uniref:5-methyltetrahydropteroyltriglutamate-- homocysteine S-methyltransferase n=1 Tax=Propioniciclava sp. TaxID=2038686 RepID=UPI0039E2B6CF
MTLAANLGFPRMGRDRELKWTLEKYWRGEVDAAQLTTLAAGLRRTHWDAQTSRGLDRVPAGDFTFYDHVLDTAVTLGAVPERFGAPFDLAGWTAEALSTYFAMARGAQGVPALELTKWFDTNYHYLVPELAPDQVFGYASRHTSAMVAEALEAGVPARAVVLGPVTFLTLAKRTDGGSTLELLDAVLPAYEAWLADLVLTGARAIQIDEPCLVLDLDATTHDAYRRAFDRLRAAAGQAELTLATYFGGLGDNLDLAVSLPVDVLHVDLVRAPEQLDAVVAALPAGTGVSLGVVDGRNIWRADLSALVARLAPVVEALGSDRVQIAPSCSLLHVPFDAAREADGDAELAGWLSFALQRLDEVSIIARALNGDPSAREGLDASDAAVASRAASARVHRAEVQARLAEVTPDWARRASGYPERAGQQHTRLGLPLLPTTTIGSFPQTAEVRRLRAAFRKGTLDADAYRAGLEDATRACVRIQEDLGLDVLVHGEFERTDMVEYFGEKLDGFATTGYGWVQSYGSRCVKPPVLFGDVARPEPMTVDWARFAAGLTDRPMKGMLTGPVTILQWSFVRDDQPESVTAAQVALALRDEVLDLEAAGLPVIQVDEPALREGLPLRRGDWDAYLAWATEAFRLAVAGVRDDTQVHTHMCYAEFGDVMDAIIALDADVISMEASRSGMTLLDELTAASYPNEVGPGVWDIHSPRVPDAAEVDALLTAAVDALGADRLWVNPDCGLKTRGWPEVEASLTELVAAAERARARTTSL